MKKEISEINKCSKCGYQPVSLVDSVNHDIIGHPKPRAFTNIERESNKEETFESKLNEIFNTKQIDEEYNEMSIGDEEKKVRIKQLHDKELLDLQGAYDIALMEMNKKDKDIEMVSRRNIELNKQISELQTELKGIKERFVLLKDVNRRLLNTEKELQDKNKTLKNLALLRNYN